MFEKLVIPQEMYPSDSRFGSGPSLVPPEHLENLANTGSKLLGTSHRKPKIKNLVKEVQEGLKVYFDLPSDFEVILGNGGATFSWDMIGLGLVDKKSSHHVSGEFSNKWYKAHTNIPWIDTTLHKVEYGEGLEAIADSDVDTICLTLNETSTGVQMTSIPEVGEHQIICMDSTSGAGQIETQVQKVDYYYFSPQKVFAAEGGLFVGFMSTKAKERALKLKAEKQYIPVIMDWELAINNSIKNQTYNTPSVSNLFLLNEQVKLMNTLGRNKVTEMAKAKAHHIYSWAEQKDYLSCFVKDSQYRSQAVATIDVDDKIPVGDLTARLRELNCVEDIDAYRKLGRNQFRISLFHNVTLENLQKLTAILSHAIESV